MANVLVFGHQNPDNDAIMSAVVLSQLLNQVEYAGNTYEGAPKIHARTMPTVLLRLRSE